MSTIAVELHQQVQPGMHPTSGDVKLEQHPASANADQNDTAAAGTNPNQPSKPLRRACDCCRKRKVKCDGLEPCGPCKKASIRCAYLQPPKKKGPKGLRSARVLHALRRIDDTVVNTGNISPTSPLSPSEHHGAWGTGWQQGWSQTSPNGTPMGYAYQPDMTPPGTMPGTVPVYAPPTSMPQSDGTYFPPQQMPPAMPTSMPQGQQQLPQHPPQYQHDAMPQHQQWGTPNSASVSVQSDQGAHHVLSPATTTSETFQSQQHASRLPSDTFQPYIQLFFQHMFPIMPVIDKQVYLDPNLYNSASSCLSSDMYCFLCAICAATIVQLDASIPQPSPISPGKATDDLFAEECLRERKNYDYVESASTLSVMTSFFLFAYYGNHEQHLKAWHCLQECITFSEHLNMDSNDSYTKLPPVEAQWRRRLYWLLFITERAYAVQRRRHCRLHRGVDMPSVFDSEDPQLLTGFVNLANLFSAVDDSFVAAWRGSRRASLCNEDWLQQTQKALDATAQILQQNGEGISETQHMDISVTREWLHVLAWQMGVSNGLIWQETSNGAGGLGLDYPIELARKVVELTTGANRGAIDAHGIGMEQKLSDIAGCLADVLKCTAGDTSNTFYEGKQYLNILLQQLSSIRGKESRYLRPLMSKMEGLMGYEMNNSLPPPDINIDGQQLQWNAMDQLPDINMGRGLSMSGGVDMLRRLSMSGNLGMPGLAMQDNLTMRRPSGRVFNEEETDAMGPWLAVNAHGPGM
ncbi:hypothetical protein K431DRAFT_284328 [Polychaeton citri CBS 116435]|uniref:Zn(2)-C6 fungal-type domain-containing protein n=1 Tax=Polychaeton citri CBS 116435 TaxID=1314669 RepID=A0A9P4UQT3_9PEZI|nr:hypothetical protein K431DRAFT_284328 [Polychaeton citri CBS 116435]